MSLVMATNATQDGRMEKRNMSQGKKSTISFRTGDSAVCLLKMCGKGADRSEEQTVVV